MSIRMKLMKNFIEPVMRRAGTAVASMLVSYGVNAETSQQIATGLIAAALVAFDLVSSYLERKNR